MCVCVLLGVCWSIHFILFYLLYPFKTSIVLTYSSTMKIWVFNYFTFLWLSLFILIMTRIFYTWGAFVVNFGNDFVGALKQTSIFQASLKYTAFLKWMNEGRNGGNWLSSFIHILLSPYPQSKRHKSRFLLCDRLVTLVNRRWSPRFKVQC